MNTTLALAFPMVAISARAQGQINFANHVPGKVDAPGYAYLEGHGPGPDFSAEIVLVRDRLFIPLLPTSRFMAHETGDDEYWIPQTVNVPDVAPGSSATFVVRAWHTSAGSFAAAIVKGQSAPFTITVGGGGLPPADLVGLLGFTFGVPEPSILTLGGLGVCMLWVSRRKGRC